MADLTAWMNQIRATLDPANRIRLDAAKQAYQNGVSGENADYGSTLAQARQQLSQIPGGYDARRADAGEAAGQELSRLPRELADSGAAPGSGAALGAGAGIRSAYRGAMESIGQEQGKAVRQEQDDIASLGAQHRAKLESLAQSARAKTAQLAAAQAAKKGK